MFIVILFQTVKNWKLVKHPLTDGWLNNLLSSNNELLYMYQLKIELKVIIQSEEKC